MDGQSFEPDRKLPGGVKQKSVFVAVVDHVNLVVPDLSVWQGEPSGELLVRNAHDDATAVFENHRLVSLLEVADEDGELDAPAGLTPPLRDSVVEVDLRLECDSTVPKARPDLLGVAVVVGKSPLPLVIVEVTGRPCACEESHDRMLTPAPLRMPDRPRRRRARHRAAPPHRRVRQAGAVEDLVDLDAARREIDRRRHEWTALGLTVGEVTWRDEAEGWPWTLKRVRDEVRNPDSVGVTVRKGSQEGEVVLFRGGWCDFGYWSGDVADDPINDAPGYPDQMTVEEFGKVLDRLAALFR